MEYVLTFRTLPNGSFRWMRGLSRGYWQLLAVPEGSCPDMRGRGVRLIARSDEGIEGVTPRSGYYLGEQYRALLRQLLQLRAT